MANGKHARHAAPIDEGQGARIVEAAPSDEGQGALVVEAASAGEGQDAQVAEAAPAGEEWHAPSVDPVASDSKWDDSIAKAPNSHKSRHKHKHGHHGHHGHRRKMGTGKKVLIGVVIAVVAILAAAGIAVALYVNSINSAMSLGKDADEIKGALTATHHAEPFYMLLMGVDAREGAAADSILANDPEADVEAGVGSDGAARSDTIMLVRVDVGAGTVSILTVPRDTPYVYGDGVIRGVNYAYADGGGAEVIKAVSDISGLDISHYVEIDANGMVDLVNGLGGIDEDVPMTFDYTNMIGDPVHLDAGWQHLDGDQALALSGMRTLYSDKQDQRHQTAARQVVEGIIGAVVSQPAPQIPGTVADAAACVATDMSVGDIADMAQKFGSGVTVYTGSGPTAGAKDPYAPYDPPKEGVQWLNFVDDEGWARVMKAFTNGEDISQVSYKGDKVHYAGQPEETWDRGLVTPDKL